MILAQSPTVFQLPHMLLQLQRSAQHEQALETLIDQLHETSSASYGQWLTAEYFSQFGFNARYLNAITGWLSKPEIRRQCRLYVFQASIVAVRSPHYQ